MPRLLAGLVIVAAAVLALGSYRMLHVQTSTVEADPAPATTPDLFAANRGHDEAQELVGYGPVETTVKSDYSNIRIRRLNNTRTLCFVRDSGEEVVESMLDLLAPHHLLVPYTRYMFLSYLFRPSPEKVLIVGLGGGSMVHFLQHYDPNVKVDVVDIDPVVLKLADKYFGARSGGNVNIMTKDGFHYLKNTDARYDVIYMDAFLKPSDDTDLTGVPLKLKAPTFYQAVQKKLNPDGLMVFNINPHDRIDSDIKNIRDSFPQMYVFEIPNGEGTVVVASMAQERMPRAAMLSKARELDRRFRASFSFREMAAHLQQ